MKSSRVKAYATSYYLCIPRSDPYPFDSIQFSRTFYDKEECLDKFCESKNPSYSMVYMYEIEIETIDPIDAFKTNKLGRVCYIIHKIDPSEFGYNEDDFQRLRNVMNLKSNIRSRECAILDAKQSIQSNERILKEYQAKLDKLEDKIIQ